MAINLVEEYKKKLGGIQNTLSNSFSSPLGRFASTTAKEATGFLGDVKQGFETAVQSARVLPAASRQAQSDADKALALQKQAQQLQLQKKFKDARKLMDEAELARNQSEGLGRSLMTDYKERALRSGTGGVKSLLTASGLKAGLPTVLTTSGIGGVLGGGLSAVTGGDFYEGAGQGVGSGARVAGLSRVTSPIIDKVLGKASNLGAKAFASGGLNVLEDTAYTAGTEGRLPTVGENILSFGIGTAGPVASASIQQISNLKNKLAQLFKQQMPDRPMKELQRTTDEILNKMWKKKVDKNGRVQYIRDNRFGSRVMNAKDFVTKNKQSAYGLLGGVEVTQDENGEYQVTFNPEKAALGVGLMAGINVGKSAINFPKDGMGTFSSMADKKVRFEIDDSGAKLKDISDEVNSGENLFQLDDVIDHPKFFRQYPEFRGVKVLLDPDSTTKGSFDGEIIRINPADYEEGLQSTLLHEIQHAIQEKEGFARGGNAEEMLDIVKKTFKERLPLAEKHLNDLIKKRALENDTKYDDLIKNQEQLVKQIKKALDKYNAGPEEVALYKRLAGEIEARDVQARMNLTPEQRRTTLPYQSQEIPLKDQIVRFDGGTQASVKNRTYNKTTNDLIESYASGEAQIKKLEELQSVVDAQENPKKFRQLADEIAKVETGNRSAIKQLAQHHNVSDYDILDAITTYIDAGARRGKRTVDDFYRYLPEDTGTMASMDPQSPTLRKTRPGSYTNVPEIDNPLVKKAIDQNNKITESYKNQPYDPKLDFELQNEISNNRPRSFEAEMDQMVQSRPPVGLQRPNNVEKINQSEARKMAQDAMVSIEGNKDRYIGVLKKYFGESESAQTKAVKQVTTLNLPKEIKGMDVVNAIEGTGPTPKGAEGYIKRFRDLDNEVFEAAKGAGIDIRFLKDHITHFWANTPEQVQEAYIRFGRTYGGAKKRQIPTYQEGIEILGLTPKYTDPKQILAESIRRLEKAKAGINAFNELKKLNLVVPASVGSTMPGFEAIRAPGFPQNFSAIDDNMAIAGQWYAPKELAAAINKAFSPVETSGLAGVLNKTGKLSGLIQDLSLSGGVAGTPINAFTIANIQKEVLGGRPIRAAQAFIRSFSDKVSKDYFTKKADVIVRMQENDIAVNSNLTIEDLAPIGFVGGGKQAISSLIKRDFGQARDGVKAAWESAMGNPTFKRFLPMLQVQFFEDIERQAMKAGKSQQEASQVAAMALKKWSGTKGIYQQKTADKLTQDAVKTFFFAPKFREAMINFWINNAKAVSPVKLEQGKVKLNNPLSLENRANTTFVAASIATYLMMDQINYALNGKHMNENPSGTEDKLLIPTDSGDVIGVPFLSSIATVPRGIYRVGKQLASGNIEAGVKDAVSTFGSQPVKTLSDISRNEDYFGKPITKDSQTPLEKFQNIASYAIGNNAHPYYKELTDPRNTEDPAYQRISRAAEAPLRFYTKDSLKDKEYFGARDKYLSKNEAGFYPQKASTLRDELQSGEITKEQMESRMQEIAREERVRNKVKETGESFQDGDIYGIMRNGKVSIINLSDLEKPQLTGDREIDSIVQKEYATALSKRVNDIADLYRSNKITKEDAQQKIRDIELERYKTQLQSGNKSPTKPRTITDILNSREESDLESQENQAIKEYKQGKVSSQDLSSKLKTIKVKKLKYKKPKKIKVKGYKLKKIKLKQARKPKKTKLIKVKRSGSLS